MSNIQSHINAMRTDQGTKMALKTIFDSFLEIQDVDIDASATSPLLLEDLSFGAGTTPITLAGAFTTGISIAADGTTGLEVTSAFTGTTMILLAGTATDGISITGACGTPLDITGAFTTGISIAANGTTGLEITSAFSGTDGIVIAGTCSDNAVEITGVAQGAGILINYTIPTATSYALHVDMDTALAAGNVEGVVIALTNSASGINNFRAFTVDLTMGAECAGPYAGYFRVDVGDATVGGLSAALGMELILSSVSGANGEAHGMTIDIALPDVTSSPGSVTNKHSFIKMETWGNQTGEDAWDDNANIFFLNGMTSGAGNIVSAQEQTLRINIEGTSRYLMLSSVENCLTLGNCTTAIDLAGAMTTGIIISGACGTAGISISGDQVLGTLFHATAAADAAYRATIPTGITLGAGVDINATSTGIVTSGLTMQGSGTFTTGITLSATAITTGIAISAGSMTDAILISGTTPVDGIQISSACSAYAINLSGANATALVISGANTSASMLISGTWGSSANYGAITLAGNVAGTALALGASATSLIGVRIDLTAAVTAGNDFMAIHSELETSGAMVDGFIIGMYQRVRVAHVAYENYAIWGRMDVNVAQTGDTGNQYLGVLGSVGFAAGAHALLATGGGYGVQGTASIATGGTLDQPLIGGYFECNAVDTIAGETSAVKARMLGFCDYGTNVLCQTSEGVAAINIRTQDAAKLHDAIRLDASTSGGASRINHVFNFTAADESDGANVSTTTITDADSAEGVIKIVCNGTDYYIPFYDAGVIDTEWADVDA